MDPRTRTTSPVSLTEVTEAQLAPPVDKISAYYSLVFPHFTFYVQTLSVTIGRRCAPNSHASTSSGLDPHNVDVDLGALKSVSRLHARIEYDHDEDRFVLVVIGRNGAWIDGIWCGSGTRAPLGDRSQIQIASRTFHFILPPTAAPEDTPTPSSQSSSHRLRSPSLDITSISPPSSQHSHFPSLSTCLEPSVVSRDPEVESRPLPRRKLPQASRKRLPNSNSIGKNKKLVASKKKIYGKGESPIVTRPKPEDIPPKPTFTYAQLIYQAIKAIGGKATLQEICTWIMETHAYYQHADPSWMSSVRHNLSSSRAFLKLERCGGDRGKGFFWKLDENHSQVLEEQEAKNWQTCSTNGSAGAEGTGRKKKERVISILDPPLKRSVKGSSNGPLPPPLTTTPLPAKVHTMTTAQATSAVSSIASKASAQTAATGVFAYPQQTQMKASTTPAISNRAQNCLNAQDTKTTHALAIPPSGTSSVTNAIVSSQVVATPSATSTHPHLSTPLVSNVNLPIILGPIPPTHPDYVPSHPHNSAKEGYMILHERTLILDPGVFGGLPKDALAELEKIGTIAALQVLKEHMVKVLKARRVKGRGKNGKRIKRNEDRNDISGLELAQQRPGLSGMSHESAALCDSTAKSNTSGRQMDVDSVDEGCATKRRKLDCTP